MSSALSERELRRWYWDLVLADVKFDPDQPRDEDGRWAGGPGGDTLSELTTGKPMTVTAYRAGSVESFNPEPGFSTFGAGFYFGPKGLADYWSRPASSISEARETRQFSVTVDSPLVLRHEEAVNRMIADGVSQESVREWVEKQGHDALVIEEERSGFRELIVWDKSKIKAKDT